jgi:pimeloyl-ACP methyl ester carboxylesterase
MTMLKQLVAAAIVAASAFTVAEAADKPTVVLVHGAFADASSWNGVIGILGKDGYPVVAVANPLRGVGSDGDYVRRIVSSIKGEVVLVGHSYGGSVINAAAAESENVKSLVFVAAFAPDVGETAIGLSGKFPGSTPLRVG